LGRPEFAALSSRGCRLASVVHSSRSKPVVGRVATSVLTFRHLILKSSGTYHSNLCSFTSHMSPLRQQDGSQPLTCRGNLLPSLFQMSHPSPVTTHHLHPPCRLQRLRAHNSHLINRTRSHHLTRITKTRIDITRPKARLISLHPVELASKQNKQHNNTCS
jgi:hypothetical protein